MLALVHRPIGFTGIQSWAHLRSVPSTRNRLSWRLLKGFPARRSTRTTSMAGSGDKNLMTVPGNHTDVDPATQGFMFQQTMYRIKDPKRSLDFYTRIVGMRLLTKLDFPEMKFSLYFLGYHPAQAIPEDSADRVRLAEKVFSYAVYPEVEWMFSQPASLELTHNWGTESDAEFKGYHSGNDDPKGYGHIGLAVPDVEAACKRFEELGVEFVKKPNDGKMMNIAFIKDPDEYWIEILNPKASRQFA